MRTLFCIAVIILSCSVSCYSVKIGVSKPNPNTTHQTTTLAPEIHSTTQNLETTPLPSPETDDTVVFTTTSSSTTTEHKGLPTTFPTKGNQPTVTRTITRPTRPSTTTTATTTTDSNLDINNATSLHLQNSTIVLDAGSNLPLHYYCSCDLHVSFCDINCCCDRDCALDMLKVFSCNAPPKHPDLQTRLEDFHYNHGLPSCKVNDGWLCVFRTNLKPKTDKCPILNLDTSTLYKWPQVSLIEDDQRMNQEDLMYYKYGEPLQIIDMETQMIQNIDLPTSFKSPTCQLMTPIKHLVTYENYCLLEDRDLLLDNLSRLLNGTSNARVLKTPRAKINDISQEMDNLAAIQICRKIRGSDESSQCYNMDSLNISAELTDFGYESAMNIEFIILHNYTSIQGLIIELDVDFIDDDNENTEIWQNFKVNYVYRNASADSTVDLIGANIEFPKAKPISGPLGYLQGEPIIVAQLMPSNDDAAVSVEHTFTYFDANASANPYDYMLPIFTSRHGLCYKDQKSSMSNVINYGINVDKSCNLRLNHAELHQSKLVKANYTDYCQRLQEAIMKQLLPPYINNNPEQLSTIYISQRGKPRPLRNEWLPLNVKNYEYTTITGEFIEQTQSYICRNMILRVGYEFHVGEFMLRAEPHQRLVKHVNLFVGQRHDLEFEVAELVELPLTMSAMFYDIQRNQAASINYLRSSTFTVLYFAFMACITSLFNSY